ncbi:hypothetical protein G1C98_1104 [Bifidobacterium sp. DSM 109960]|uniref:Uncharacterized protein n=1 Tax=Bifidobacterium erythrocebi TaxID=2675325 RepID=A0A7Y0EU15_9BIFI|nr:hypothetical protein [Bifidobacterium sp. DSM 109960]
MPEGTPTASADRQYLALCRCERYKHGGLPLPRRHGINTYPCRAHRRVGQYPMPGNRPRKSTKDITKRRPSNVFPVSRVPPDAILAARPPNPRHIQSSTVAFKQRIASFLSYIQCAVQQKGPRRSPQRSTNNQRCGPHQSPFPNQHLPKTQNRWRNSGLSSLISSMKLLDCAVIAKPAS